MIELVDRFEAEHERGISVLLEDHSGEKRRLETVRAAVADDAAQMKALADKLLPVLKAYRKEENPAS